MSPDLTLIDLPPVRVGAEPGEQVHEPKRRRTVTLITGLKAGDPAVLAPQPMILASVAWELGQTDRKTYFTACRALLQTKQSVGRVFSFHKNALITGGFITCRKVARGRNLKAET